MAARPDAHRLNAVESVNVAHLAVKVAHWYAGFVPAIAHFADDVVVRIFGTRLLGKLGAAQGNIVLVVTVFEIDATGKAKIFGIGRARAAPGLRHVGGQAALPLKRVQFQSSKIATKAVLNGRPVREEVWGKEVGVFVEGVVAVEVVVIACGIALGSRDFGVKALALLRCESGSIDLVERIQKIAIPERLSEFLGIPARVR